MERSIAISAFRANHQIDENRIDSQKFAKEIELMISMTNSNPSLRPTAHSLILDQFIQLYWMKNILNSAIPEIPPSFPSSQRSLEYDENQKNDIEVTAIHPSKQQNLENEEEEEENHGSGLSLSPQNTSDKAIQQSPMFLVSSPSTPPNGLNLVKINNNSPINPISLFDE